MNTPPLLTDLQRLIEGNVSIKPEQIESVSEDFGHLYQKRPQVVVFPTSSADIAKVLRYANQQGVSVSTRGAGHSQGGQSLNEKGILLNMKHLNRIGTVDPNQRWVQAQSGVVWKDLLNRVAEFQLMPPVMTDFPEVTLGGTLSVGGLGPASFRYGAQASQCLRLEVVTGTGEQVWCSEEEYPELFRNVRCGLGQLGVITQAQLSLKPYRPYTKTCYFHYHDFADLMTDCEAWIQGDRVHHLEGIALKGPRNTTSSQVMSWNYVLAVSIETKTPKGLKVHSLLESFHGIPLPGETVHPTVEFILRLEARFEQLKQVRYEGNCQPWMDILVPWDTLTTYVDTVLSHYDLTPSVLFWPFQSRLLDLPMFRIPEDELFMLLGFFPSLSPEQLESSLPAIRKMSDLGIKLGGKRYLSGWLDFDLEDWCTHFGPYWDDICYLKQKYDPNRILNPKVILYPPQ